MRARSRSSKRPAVGGRELGWRGWQTDALIVLGLVVVALWQFVPMIDTNPFHRDEARWTYKARLVREWRHPLGDRWTDEGYPRVDGSFEEAYRMRDQPPLAAYLTGIGLVLQGRDLTINGYWNYERNHDWNVAQGNMPALDDLRAARRTAVVIGMLTVVAIYALARRLTGRAGGMVAGLAFALHPLAIETESRAWADPVLTLLIVLAALAAAAFGERPSWRRGVVLGVLLGLGGSAKLTPLLVAGCLGGLGLLCLVLRRWVSLGGGGRRPWSLIAVPVVAFAVFVAVYPYLWRDPIGNTYNLFDYRAHAFSWQGDDWEWGVIESRTDALRRIGQQLGRGGSVSGRMASGLADLGVSVPAGWRIGELDMVLALAGLVIAFAVTMRRGVLGGDGLALAVVLAHVIIVVGTIGVDFPRYYLPVLLLSVLGIAYSVEYAMAAVRLIPALGVRLGGRLRPERALSDGLERLPTGEPSR